MSYRIAACCQLGELVTNRKGVQEFKQFSDCQMGTVQRAAMLKIMGITKDELHLLTPELVEQYKSKLQAKLIPTIKKNLQALSAQIKRVSSLPDNQKMFRISSDLLPLYTHIELGALYDETVMSMIRSSLSHTGELIRKHNIRVSSHPSQFTTLSSDNPDVIVNSIRDLEHHVMIFESMGLNPDDHGVVINIHANGKSFDLPESAQHLFNWISLEPDEKQAGFNKVLGLCETYGVRMVLDLHHHWCENGEYLSFNSDNTIRALKTWPSSQRPLLHISQPRGLSSKKEMCAHSDMIDNLKLIEYLRPWLSVFDCDVEVKFKNVSVNYLCGKLNEIS
ncbi:UV-endonuclease [Vibrio phage 1.084.O._10N.261.49.F5]|nr:UV-endonuclease [Vibrio phage 1.084.O._10N.261.49.F5]